MRIAAVGDIHCTKTSHGRYQTLLTHVASHADVLLLCGDMTDYGLPEEAEVLMQELRTVAHIPVIAVLGNHDHESNHVEDVKRILTSGGVHLLDGDSFEHQGVGFAGTKGFGGGFDDRMLQPWGEMHTKDFVAEGVQESVKLESALAKLKTPLKIVLLHYAPIRATVEGEPSEIFPFLGTSRLEEPLGRHGATLVVHGHAHHGSPEGRSHGTIPVYNVAMPLLARINPQQPPVKIIELPMSTSREAAAA